MTSKTELLPCPFCACDVQLVRRKVGFRISGNHAEKCPFKGDAPLIFGAEDWNTRAPAEDVRAVVEEPVADVVMFEGEKIIDGTLAYMATAEIGDRLYRHPPRPVAPQCSEVSSQCSEMLRTQGRPVVLPECPSGYGHGGHWCGPEYNCWLDRRPKVNK